MYSKSFPIPIQPAPQPNGGDCQSGESYALMVLGDSMQPEFNEGEVIVVEPEGLARPGSFVVAFANDEHIFRQLMRDDAGWWLHALNPAYPPVRIADLSAVKGVVLLKQIPGNRKARKFYID
jgi:phage repressor protein C with HTH and peptisase S24 domain